MNRDGLARRGRHISLMKVGPLRERLNRWKEQRWPRPAPAPTAKVLDND
jgi:hypothetical protein